MVEAQKELSKEIEVVEEKTLPDVEVEVSDDTPVEDQNRKNLPKELVNKLDSEELDEYDSKVKDKIYQLKKVWHDERREKERVQRENQEAVQAAKKLLKENTKLKEQFLNTADNAADLEISAAKKAYKEAFDDGDSEKAVEAQQKLSEATYRKQNVKRYKIPLQTEENAVQQESEKQPAALPPDAKAMDWQNKNDWFGQDEEMTSLALGLHEKLVKQNGVGYATTNEYYTRIDETMRKRFPENFELADDTESTKETVKTKPSAVVAPVTRTTSSKKVRLSMSQINLAKKLGLSPEQYARELIRLENKND